MLLPHGVFAQTPVNPPLAARNWADLAKLPDWSGVWTPSRRQQEDETTKNPVPWTAKAAETMARMLADEKAGRPQSIFANCLPQGMPSWMLVTHSALEILFTPERVAMLGELNGSQLRRIYNDGRPHPQDPDLTFHGHSVGRWEKDALILDTVGILPQVYIATKETAGVPSNGNMEVLECIHLIGPDTLADDLEITAPAVLTGPWKTSRFFYR